MTAIWIAPANVGVGQPALHACVLESRLAYPPGATPRVGSFMLFLERMRERTARKRDKPSP